MEMVKFIIVTHPLIVLLLDTAFQMYYKISIHFLQTIVSTSSLGVVNIIIIKAYLWYNITITAIQIQKNK